MNFKLIFRAQASFLCSREGGSANSGRRLPVPANKVSLAQSDPVYSHTVGLLLLQWQLRSCQEMMTVSSGPLGSGRTSRSPRPGTHIAAVVNEASEVATLGGVDDGVMVHPEHVAAPYALVLVAFLPHVRDHLPGKRP